MSSRVLTLRNRQRRVRLDLKFIRRIVTWLLSEELGLQEFDLSLQFVTTAEITALNETYLRHKGSTDVITFDYAGAGESSGLVGDVIICVDEALGQAPQFRTIWQTELARYIVHGVLHLLGFDDKTPARRRRMKRREDELLRTMVRHFPVSKLGAKRE